MEITKKDLLAKYGITMDELNCEIGPGDIAVVAGLFDGVESPYFEIMDLEESEKVDIQRKAENSTQLGAIQCLSSWRDSHPDQATFGGLLEIFLEMQKFSIADRLCKYFTTKGKQIV